MIKEKVVFNTVPRHKGNKFGLKAFFFESRMAQRPQDSEPELQTWFWGDTAGGQLVAAIAKYMVDTGDEAMARVANGIAR